MSDRARMVIFIAGTIALFTAVSLLVRATTSFDYTRDHASTRTNPWGTKAWRELLERSDVTTQTWTQPLTGLTDEVGFLVLLDPVEPIEADERAALERWVRNGGRLVIAPFAYREATTITGRSARVATEQTLEEFAVRAVQTGDPGATVAPAADVELTADLTGVEVPTEGRLQVVEQAPAEDVLQSAEVLLADASGGAVAVAVTHGRGTVLALCEAEMLANATLPKADNVVFAANLVFAGGAPEAVYFDEYHHGFAGGEGVLAGPEVDATPFHTTALALLGVALIYTIGRSRRFGAAVRRSDDSRRSSADYVRALAQIYARAGAGRPAATMLAAGLRRRIAAAIAMPSSADVRVLAGELTRRGLPGGEIAELLGKLEGTGEAMSNAELLTLAQQVARYERML